MRTILVERGDGGKDFRINIEDGDKATFSPWSPAKDQYNGSRANNGTLRIYRGSKENCIAVFSGVSGYRDTTLDYQEKLVVEEGATIWKSDNKGYSREEKVQRQEEWGTPELPAAPAVERAPKRGRRVVDNA